MLTLILDSSSGLSLALLSRSGKTIGACLASGRPLPTVHTAVEAVLRNSGTALADLDQIGVVRGPGSWTGIHVALATAKTISQVFDLPIVPLSMLDAIAETQRLFSGTICALLDARNGNIYSALYESSGCRLEQTRNPAKTRYTDLARELQGASRPVVIAGKFMGEISQEFFGALPESETTYAPLAYPHLESFGALLHTGDASALTGAQRFSIEPLYLMTSEDSPRIYREQGR